MAKEVQNGRYIDVVLSEDVAVGDVVALSGICGVAMATGLTGETIAVDTEGVYEVPTDATFSIGAEVFYDPAAGKAVASGDHRMGVAVGADAGVVLVKLNVG